MRTGNPVDGCAIFWRASRYELPVYCSFEVRVLGSTYLAFKTILLAFQLYPGFTASTKGYI